MLNSLYPWIYFDMAAGGGDGDGGGGDGDGDGGGGSEGGSDDGQINDPVTDQEIQDLEDRLDLLALVEHPLANPSLNPLLYQHTGNPLTNLTNYNINAGVQARLPNTAPRHHIISSWGHPLDGCSYIYINKQPVNLTNNPNSGFDFVVTIQDVTGDTLQSTAQSVTSNTSGVDQIGLKYGSTTLMPAYGVERDIEVTWNSGFTKTFIMLLPGLEQQGSKYLQGGGTNTFNFGVKTHDGPPSGDFDYTGGIQFLNSGYTANHIPFTYSQTFVVNDPAGVYWNGDWLYDPNQVGGTGVSTQIYDLRTPFNYSNSISWGAHGAMAHGSGGNISSAFNFRGVPDKNTLLEQEFEVLSVHIPTINFGGAANLGLNNIGFDSSFANNWIMQTLGWPQMLGGGGLITPWFTLRNKLKDDITQNAVDEPFSHSIIYSEYLYVPSITSTNTFVCDDPSSPNYYLTTCKDCSGNTIPGCPGSISSTIMLVGSACCTVPCKNVLGFDNIDFDCATYGATNGWHNIEIDSGLAGTPWTSGSDYTWTLTTTGTTGASITMSAPPTGGNTFTHSCVTNTTSGSEHTLTCSGNAQISTGLKISGTGIPSNSFVGNISLPVQPSSTYSVTKFEIVNSTGGIVSATTAATSTMTFSAGTKIVWRALQPNSGPGGIGGYYTIKAVDSLGCDVEYSFTICEDPQVAGCTSSTAINYNSSATVGCVNCCVWCNKNSDGLLTDASTGYSGDLFNVTSLTNTQITTNDSTSNGKLAASANLINSIFPYLDLDSTQSFTMTLYKTTTFGGALPGSATATQTGLGTNQTGASHIFTGLAYGYYAVKVQLVDSNEAHGLEDCYTVFYGKVQTYVCDDSSSSSYNPSIPIDLAVHNQALCTTSINCCTLSNIRFIYNGCTTSLTADLACDPLSTQVVGYWEYNGTPITGSGFTLNNVGATPINLTPIGVYGPGIYKVSITATYSSHVGQTHICNDEISIQISPREFLLCGCTDPAALNYNLLATADCIGVQGGTNHGCCTYCIYGCMDPTANNYNSSATCDDGSCTWDIYGCTDPSATNYDPAATIDDGSCTYAACLDQHAANYLEDCQGNLVPNATINNASCCFYPCTDPKTGQPSNPATLTVVTVDSTGTCTTPISDGTAVVTVTINSGAPTWTIYYTDGAGTTLYTDSTIYSGSGSATIWTGLAPGVYKAIVTDSYGCVDELLFAVSSSPIDVGCTDPAATNYDPNAECDDDSCIFCGCMDPMAINYNPGATCDDGTCIYPAMRLGDCIPATIEDTLNRIRACTLKRGSEFLKDIKLGVNEDCFTLNKWKLILIEYLLGRYKYGLDCLFNCEDEETPAPPEPCVGNWVIGGPATGVNDQGYAGSSITTGEGTTITDPNLFFVAATILYYGDMIKMPSGIIWKMIEIGPSGCTNGCYNPETTLGAKSGHWVICNSAYELNITTTTNYIDNFINFVNIFCEDCDIETDYEVTGGQPVEPTYKRTLDFTQNNITFNF